MLSLLWYVLKEQNEIQYRKTAAEQMLKDAELYRLRHQLQPHFLFNSLNSISALTAVDAEKARTMIQQLSDFLRGTLKRDEVQFITLREELQHLQLYLDIEKVRFGHRLDIAVNYTEEAAERKLPALLLQPAVENAIKFGLYNTLDKTAVVITASTKSNTLVVSISNPYDEEDIDAASGTGFGLASIRRRLYLLFGRYDLLETIKADHTFTLKLIIPQPIPQ
jgi:LytS/YehU family sensor histidine kinase